MKVSFKIPSQQICSLRIEIYLVFARVFASAVYILCDCINVVVVFPEKKESLSARNVGHFVLLLPVLSTL